MEVEPLVQPLPLQHRQKTFWLLLTLFMLSLPFLYLYATGYRFEFGEAGNLISTGGMYIAVERTGAEIYIDDELVRETRTFRRAFYAQSLTPGTHRVHVQKPDHHTWVKELPVSAHLVTEAQAFNLPLVPQVRVISEWQSATGSAIVRDFDLAASTTNELLATSTLRTRGFTQNSEYDALLLLFSTSSATSTETFVDRVTEGIDTLIQATTTATSSIGVPTTTKEWRGVKLYEKGGDIYVRWVGTRDDMPYYYCAEDFPPYSGRTSTTTGFVTENPEVKGELTANTAEFIHPVQTVPEDAVCEPEIQIDRRGQEVRFFDFFLGSTDFIILALEDGVYVVEVDDRAWQNVQPLLLGEDLDVRIENSLIYAYDGELIYQVMLET